MNPTDLMILVALAGTIGGFLLIRFLLAARVAPAGPPPMLPPDPLARDLAAAVPAIGDGRNDLRKLLHTAGFYRPSALDEYLAIRATIFLGLMVATALICMAVDPSQIPVVAVSGLVAAGLGFSLPRVILGALANSRARRLVRGLPVAMDVMGLCLTAGQNVQGSIERTAQELSEPYPDLAQELQVVHSQAAMHSLERALLQWAERLEIPEIRSLALLLVQSERLGTDMVNTLLEGADSQRTLLRQKAEAQANRSNFWMLFPTLFCLWIASAIVLVGPVYLEFWKYRREQMGQLLGSARGQVTQRAMTNPQGRTAGGDGEATPTPATPAAPLTTPATPGPRNLLAAPRQTRPTPALVAPAPAQPK
ncbi:MAG: type II secretion system F family protein [Gemmataceae bacterium]